MTEELLKKKALKSQRRREVAAQKREKEKVSCHNSCNLLLSSLNPVCFLYRNEPSIAYS